MGRTKLYAGKVMPITDAKAAYDAVNALHASVWDELVSVRDAAQAALSLINEAKANAMSDYVASQQAAKEKGE